jgi:hypothetical protein
MLPVRLAVLSAIAAVCLWGLFSLLDNLNAPGLLRTQKTVLVKGCDAPEPSNRELCAQLRCQKSLLDQKRVPLRSRFEMLHPAGGWIGGRALEARSPIVLGYFACPQQAQTVLAAQWLDEQQFNLLH